MLFMLVRLPDKSKRMYINCRQLENLPENSKKANPTELFIFIC